MELALASTLSGAAFLGIEPDPQSLKAAIHNASCDFMVNTLDEALRVLKNELRKQTPLSVGLLGYAADVLPAMVERGVQPDILCETAPSADPKFNEISGSPPKAGQIFSKEQAMAAHRTAWEQLRQRGAKIVRLDEGNAQRSAIVPRGTAMHVMGQTDTSSVLSHQSGGDGVRSAPVSAAPDASTSALSPEEAAVHPSSPLRSTEFLEVVWTAANPQDLQRLDRLALELLPADDCIRRRWLEQAAGCFYRQLPRQRVLGLRQEELRQLLDVGRDAAFASSLQAPATIAWQSADGTQRSVQFGPIPTRG